jgi:hypothetical protein
MTTDTLAALALGLFVLVNLAALALLRGGHERPSPPGEESAIWQSSGRARPERFPQ